MKKVEQDRFIISVKVGPKGQITIPVEARRMFGIEVGESLLVIGDSARGMAIVKATEFYDRMGGMFRDSDSDKEPEKRV